MNAIRLTAVSRETPLARCPCCSIPATTLPDHIQRPVGSVFTLIFYPAQPEYAATVVHTLPANGTPTAGKGAGGSGRGAL